MRVKTRIIGVPAIPNGDYELATIDELEAVERKLAEAQGEIGRLKREVERRVSRKEHVEWTVTVSRACNELNDDLKSKLTIARTALEQIRAAVKLNPNAGDVWTLAGNALAQIDAGAAPVEPTSTLCTCSACQYRRTRQSNAAWKAGTAEGGGER